MSEHDSDAGSSNGSKDGQSPDSYVNEIMEREAELAARPKPEVRRRSRVPVLVALIVILLGLVGWNLVRMLRNPPAFTAEEIEQERLFTVFITSQELEAYLDSVGTLPATLGALALETEGVNYARVNDSTYVLTAEAGTTEVAHRSGEDLSKFSTVVNMVGGGNQR